MLKIKWFVVLLLLFCFQLKAQNSPEKIINDFVKNYESKGTSIAVDELYSTNPWSYRIQDGVNNIKTQLERFNEDLVGKYHGYELITIKKLGESFVLYSYFMKFDRQFLRLIFQFYKPENEWRLSSFKLDDSYKQEIEEASKVYYMDLSR